MASLGDPKVVSKGEYEKELARLQTELVRMQEWIVHEGLRVMVIFEGRDTAGKGGTIKRIMERLNARHCRVVALGMPTERERTQWYFQRYIAHLPSAGEIVLFDRSWYNRAGVERVMQFCTEEEHEEFFRTCPQLERALVRSGIILVKYWLSLSDEEQERRFTERINNPGKRWKLSPMDLEARARWVDYAEAKDEMFAYTDIKEARGMSSTPTTRRRPASTSSATSSRSSPTTRFPTRPSSSRRVNSGRTSARRSTARRGSRTDSSCVERAPADRVLRPERVNEGAGCRTKSWAVRSPKDVWSWRARPCDSSSTAACRCPPHWPTPMRWFRPPRRRTQGSQEARRRDRARSATAIPGPGHEMPAKPVGAAHLELNLVGDGYIVYQPASERMHSLNHTAALVLELCTGQNDAPEIARLLQRGYQLPEPPDDETRQCLASLFARRADCLMPAPRPLLSAAMIVRDEEAPGACLASLQGIVDEVIVVDTGSSDQSMTIARSFGARVYREPWAGDFSRARNAALDRVHGEWVLYIDADERLRPIARADVVALLEHSTEVAFRVMLRPFTGSTPCREFRLWRNDPRIRFEGIIHEKVVPAITAVARSESRPIGVCDLAIDHVGYEGDQTRRHHRNLPLLRAQLAAEPRNVFNWRHLASVLVALDETEEAERALETALGLVRAEPVAPAGGVLVYSDLVRLRYGRGVDTGDLIDEAVGTYPNDPL